MGGSGKGGTGGMGSGSGWVVMVPLERGDQCGHFDAKQWQWQWQWQCLGGRLNFQCNH
jgi:hypothetical protein